MPLYFRHSIIFFLFLSVLPVSAQPVFLPGNSETNAYYEILLLDTVRDFHSSIKPYFLPEIEFASSLDSELAYRGRSPLLSFISDSNLISVRKGKSQFMINPVFTLVPVYSHYKVEKISYGNWSCLGYAGLSAESRLWEKMVLHADAYYRPRAGVYGTGSYFLDDLLHAAQGPSTVNDRPESFRRYKGLFVTGYISFSVSAHISLQAGRDRNFWGDGYRSLLLSDNAEAYPFFKAIANVWKIKYVVLYTSLRDVNSDLEYQHPETKYSTMHYMSLNMTKWFNLDLFEAVVWRAEDTLGYRGFDVNYLNPVIFFRPAEYNLGSPDNMLLGGGFKLRFGKANYFYSQLMLDEFKLSEVNAGKGWWGNKQAAQAGIKMYRLFGQENLFFQSEFNFIRPFTYSHSNSLENWGNQHQPMAHPLGANLEELVFVLRNRYDRLLVTAECSYTIIGTNTDSVNVGQDIYLPYTFQRKTFGNTILQGQKNELFLGSILAEYLINPKWGLSFDLGITGRRIRTGNMNEDDIFIFLGLRTHLYQDLFFKY
jgi:hypothetical protein